MPVLQSLAPILPVRDMNASVAFYQRLGFQYEPYEEGTDYAFLSMDSQWLHLAHSGSPEFRFNPCGVYFYLDDVDSFFATIRAAGVRTINTPENRPWGVREFAVSDPDDTLLRFGQLLAKEERKISG